jgi:hypothetical protein
MQPKHWIILGVLATLLVAVAYVMGGSHEDDVMIDSVDSERASDREDDHHEDDEPEPDAPRGSASPAPAPEADGGDSATP